MEQPPKTPRPRQVTIAIWLIVAEGILFVAGAAFRQDWSDPWSFVTTPLFAALTLIWIYPILRRKGWVRGVLAALTLLLCVYTGGMTKPNYNWQDANKLILAAFFLKRALAVAELLLLFSTPATAWFSQKDRQDSQEGNESERA
jgi:hypothetical protein